MRHVSGATLRLRDPPRAVTSVLALKSTEEHQVIIFELAPYNADTSVTVFCTHCVHIDIRAELAQLRQAVHATVPPRTDKQAGRSHSDAVAVRSRLRSGRPPLAAIVAYLRFICRPWRMRHGPWRGPWPCEEVEMSMTRMSGER